MISSSFALMTGFTGYEFPDVVARITEFEVWFFPGLGGGDILLLGRDGVRLRLMAFQAFGNGLVGEGVVGNMPVRSQGFPGRGLKILRLFGQLVEWTVAGQAGVLADLLRWLRWGDLKSRYQGNPRQKQEKSGNQ